MKTFSISVLILFYLSFSASCQNKKVEDFGYRHLQFLYKNDTVDVLTRTKKGDEFKKKAILFFVQGSLAKPLIRYTDKNFYFPSPLEGFVEENYHLILVNKPGLPLIVHSDSLKKGGQYMNFKTGKVPKLHTEKNYLEYYVDRNNYIISQIKKLFWVNKKKIIVAGHSEGSSIAAYMAAKNNDITHLIYSGGTPYYSRILSMIVQERKIEKDSTNSWVKKSFEYWKSVLKDTSSTSRKHGWNSYKGTFSFSKSENEILKNLKIPILITYGTEDTSSVFNDMFHIEVIKNGNKNITFKDYVGLEHNFFGVDKKGNLNPKKYNWDKVVKDWFKWIEKTKNK